MLIAEDLLLLITDDPTGRPLGDASATDFALSAALLCDLELLGRLHLGRTDDGRNSKRVIIDDFATTGDPLLDQSLRLLTPQSRTPTRAVTLLKKGVRKALYGRLVDAGVLRKERGRALGMVPVTRYPATSRTTEAQALAAVNHVFVTEGRDPRTEALIACLAVAGMVQKLVPEVHPMLTKRDIRRRARAYMDAHWQAQAAHRAALSEAGEG